MQVYCVVRGRRIRRRFTAIAHMRFGMLLIGRRCPQGIIDAVMRIDKCNLLGLLPFYAINYMDIYKTMLVREIYVGARGQDAPARSSQIIYLRFSRMFGIEFHHIYK